MATTGSLVNARTNTATGSLVNARTNVSTASAASSTVKKNGGIGYFGGIKFYVKTSNGKPDILSFSNFSWKSSINYEEHKRTKKKPLLEVTDRNLDEITLDIYLSAYFNQSPMKKWNTLRRYCLYYKAYPFVLGGQRIGSHKFIITSVSNDPQKILKNGKMVAIRVSVTFTEYIAGKKSSKKKTTTKSGNSSGSSKKTSKSYTSYTVKKNDTLWSIAKKKLGAGSKYKKIYNANKTAAKGFHKLTSPSQSLKEGWVIKIPKK